MKNVFLTVLLVGVLSLTAFATESHLGYPTLTGVSAQSVGFELTPSRVGFTYLNDGLDSLVSVNYQIFQVMPRLNFNLMAVSNVTNNVDGTNLWVGAMFDYEVFNTKGVIASVCAGWKGLNLNEGTFEDNDSFVFGFKLSFPLVIVK